jgi:hypothetical protein
MGKLFGFIKKIFGGNSEKKAVSPGGGSGTFRSPALYMGGTIAALALGSASFDLNKPAITLEIVPASQTTLLAAGQNDSASNLSDLVLKESNDLPLQELDGQPFVEAESRVSSGRGGHGMIVSGGAAHRVHNVVRNADITVGSDPTAREAAYELKADGSLQPRAGYVKAIAAQSAMLAAGRAMGPDHVLALRRAAEEGHDATTISRGPKMPVSGGVLPGKKPKLTKNPSRSPFEPEVPFVPFRPSPVIADPEVPFVPFRPSPVLPDPTPEFSRARPVDPNAPPKELRRDPGQVGIPKPPPMEYIIDRSRPLDPNAPPRELYRDPGQVGIPKPPPMEYIIDRSRPVDPNAPPRDLTRDPEQARPY